MYKRKRLFKFFFVFLLVIVLTELTLRWLLGLGTPVLFKSDPDFEYIYAPNQNIKRFGNRITTNEYSMRSKPFNPSSDSLVVLKIGDSVINGGTLTDDKNLATSILEKELSKRYNKPIRVLNISAGSWGPDNAFAYIRKYGSFNAGLFVLVFSSHDLYDCMDFNNVVGHVPYMPDKKPLTAIGELWSRYIFPWAEEKIGRKTANSKINNLNIGTNTSVINPGWKKFISYSRSKGIDLVVVLHPTVNEIKRGTYNSFGKKIISLLNNENVPVIKELTEGVSLSFYRDDIHYNESGQKFLASEVLPYLRNYLENKKGLKPQSR